MSFKHLKRRVERGEALVEGRVRQAGASNDRLRYQWRQAWTPLRTVVAGLGAGFITGRVAPEKIVSKLGKVGGPRAVQLIGSAVGLVGSLQAAFTAMTAKDAAETAGRAAEHAEDSAAEPDPAPVQTPEAAASAGAAANAGEPDPGAAGHERPRRRDQSWDSQPSPAEAATELSER